MVIDSTHECEYCNCEKEATVYDKELEAWLCEEHRDTYNNETGYCGRNCQLGYGCDQSC